jgi:hypothetical protein
MQDYEIPGAFYLGKRYDPSGSQLTDELVLYDSRDLTTHAVIIGMTGSGKTGLGIALLEEAAIDKIPVIAIDPKGDLGNLLLGFPALRGSDFEPWVDAQAAAAAGQSVAAFAAAQAETWRKGLAEWGQSPERIQRLRDAAKFALYTPGSSAGRPISVLGAFSAPTAALRADTDLYRQHVQSTVTGLLALLGIDADPVSSREHILLSALLDHHWQQERSLDLAGLISAVQQPGLTKIGVMDLESFYPAKDRFSLAMRLNNLLAAPGFEVWTKGEPLDAGKLLYTANGQPRVSVLSIAHLNDAERMFFVTLLLNEVIAWMRAQPGTGSLRAILYMDEVFGYLPPVANPASKQLLLTLLKQARAFGLGIVLATQNPVDLDYKALSNAGTWLIGRLQTTQDRNRVRDGLLAAASAGGLDPAGLDALLGTIGKRTFLLHNVHESAPILMQTRWAMSYLRGPLTRDDIRRLTGSRPAATDASPSGATSTPVQHTIPTASRPVLPPTIPVLYATAREHPADGERLVYHPRLLTAARITYISTKHGIDTSRNIVLAQEPGTGTPDWAAAEPLTLDIAALGKDADAAAGFAPVSPALSDPANFKTWQAAFRNWLRTDQPLVLWRNPALGEISRPEESEAAFRVRLRQLAREARDARSDGLRDKYAAKFNTLDERRRRAEQAVEREQEQATGSQIDTAVSVGSALLGALFGRKRVSSTSVTRAASALRKAGNLHKQSGDVQRASETVDSINTQRAELEAELRSELTGLEADWNARAEELEEVAVRPKASDITLQFCGIGWLPFVEDRLGNLRPAM